MLIRMTIHSLIGIVFSSWFFFVGYYRANGSGDAVKGYSKIIHDAPSIPFKGDVTFPKYGGLFTSTRLEWVAILLFLSVFMSFVLRNNSRIFTVRTTVENIIISLISAAVTLYAIHLYIQNFVRGPGF